jgi:hypothetical protein
MLALRFLMKCLKVLQMVLAADSSQTPLPEALPARKGKQLGLICSQNGPRYQDKSD